MPLNDSFEPSEGEEDVLEFVKREGKTRPVDVCDALGDGESTVRHWLSRLTAAGWVDREKRGLYTFVADPRDMTDTELADVYRDHADTLAATPDQ